MPALVPSPSFPLAVSLHCAHYPNAWDRLSYTRQMLQQMRESTFRLYSNLPYARPGKTRNDVARNICCGHMFLQFPSFAAGSIVCSSKICFYFAETYSRLAKLENIGEACVHNKGYRQHASSFCKSFLRLHVKQHFQVQFVLTMSTIKSSNSMHSIESL